jgi:hypothetical protein
MVEGRRDRGRREAAGGWRLEAGGWRLEAGGWRLEAGGWRLEAGGWSLEAGGWRAVAGGRWRWGWRGKWREEAGRRKGNLNLFSVGKSNKLRRQRVKTPKEFTFC